MLESIAKRKDTPIRSFPLHYVSLGAYSNFTLNYVPFFNVSKDILLDITSNSDINWVVYKE